jgi:hypothetical protein
MQFGPVVRAASLLLVLAAAVAFAAVSLRVRGAELAALRIFLMALVLLLGAGAVEVWGVGHRLVPGGIERVAPARPRATLRWRDVISLEWSARTGWYEVRVRDGETVRVYGQLRGLPAFARAALEGVPAPVLDASPGLRERLALVASGREPPDEPEREEWKTR